MLNRIMLNRMRPSLYQGDHNAAVGLCINGGLPDAVVFLGWDFPHELRLVRTLNVPIIHIPMSDSEQEDARLFTVILGIMESLVEGDNIVAVCCEAGISRSPTICLLYLCFSKGYSFEEAEAVIRNANPAYQPEFSLYSQVRDSWRLFVE